MTLLFLLEIVYHVIIRKKVYFEGGIRLVNYEEAQNIEDVQVFLKHNHFSLVYVSRPDCGVCHAVLPQVRELLTAFPEVKMMKVDAEKIPAVAGQFSVFTVPAILFFVEGKEMIRKARFVIMAELEEQIAQLVENY